MWGFSGALREILEIFKIVPSQGQSGGLYFVQLSNVLGSLPEGFEQIIPDLNQLFWGTIRGEEGNKRGRD